MSCRNQPNRRQVYLKLNHLLGPDSENSLIKFIWNFFLKLYIPDFPPTLTRPDLQRPGPGGVVGQLWRYRDLSPQEANKNNKINMNLLINKYTFIYLFTSSWSKFSSVSNIIWRSGSSLADPSATTSVGLLESRTRLGEVGISTSRIGSWAWSGLFSFWAIPVKMVYKK